MSELRQPGGNHTEQCTNCSLHWMNSWRVTIGFDGLMSFFGLATIGTKGFSLVYSPGLACSLVHGPWLFLANSYDRFFGASGRSWWYKWTFHQRQVWVQLHQSNNSWPCKFPGPGAREYKGLKGSTSKKIFGCIWAIGLQFLYLLFHLGPAANGGADHLCRHLHRLSI